MERRIAFAVVVAVALLIFWKPLTTGEVLRYRDHAHYFEPLRLFTAEELRSGHVPLWNPYNASGEPWLANPQTGVFYPPAWIFVVLPFTLAYTLYLALHAMIFGAGAYLLFTRCAAPGAALVGAAASMASGPMLSIIDVADNYGSFSWLPLILWCAATPNVPRTLSAAAVALSFLAGQPLFAAIAAVSFVIVRLARGERALVDVAVVAFGAFAFSAVQLLPFLAMLPGTDRAAGFEARRIFGQSMPLRDWWRVAVWPSAGPLGQQFIRVVYVGLPVVAGAIAALFFALRRRVVIGWLALLVFAVVISTGPRFIESIPGSVLRYPARLVPFAALALVGLAVIAWDRVRPQRIAIDVLLALLLVVDLVSQAGPLLATEPFQRNRVPWPAAIGAESRVFRLPTVSPTLGDREAWIYGYMNLFTRRHDTGSAAPLYQTRYAALFQRAMREPPLIAVLSARYVLADTALPLQPLGRVRNVTAYANEGAIPFATLWREMPGAGVGQEAIAISDLTLTTSSATVRVNAPFAGVLVLTQQDARGWSLSVDGRPAEKLLAFDVFRAVAVKAGPHVVRWDYRPPGLVPGAILTVAAVLIVGLARLRPRRRAVLY